MVEERKAKMVVIRDSEKGFEAIDLDQIQHRSAWKIWHFGGEDIEEKSNIENVLISLSYLITA